jgi:hypothetical protein
MNESFLRKIVKMSFIFWQFSTFSVFDKTRFTKQTLKKMFVEIQTKIQDWPINNFVTLM